MLFGVQKGGERERGSSCSFVCMCSNTINMNREDRYKIEEDEEEDLKCPSPSTSERPMMHNKDNQITEFFYEDIHSL